MGPTCLSATIMQNLVTKLPKTNIVVVSAHYGLELANNFVKSLGFNPQDFGCPPVWGFLGLWNNLLHIQANIKEKKNVNLVIFNLTINCRY